MLLIFVASSCVILGRGGPLRHSVHVSLRVVHRHRYGRVGSHAGTRCGRIVLLIPVASRVSGGHALVPVRGRRAILLLLLLSHNILGQEGVFVRQLVPLERQLVQLHHVGARHNFVPDELCPVIADEANVIIGLTHLRLLKSTSRVTPAQGE